MSVLVNAVKNIIPLAVAYELLLFAAAIFLSWAIGKRSLRKFSFDTELERFLFELAIGVGIFAYSIWLIGILGFLYYWSVLLFLVVASFIFFKELKSICADIRYLPVAIKKDKLPLSLLWLFILGVIVNSIASFSPILEVDALAYHMNCPKIFVRFHKIFPVPYNENAMWPFLIEMLFTFGLIFKSISIAHLFNVLFGALGALSVYSFSCQRFSKQVAIFCGIIFYFIPAVASNSVIAYVDVALTFFSFLALYAFFNWLKGNDTKWLLLSGILCGLASSIKYLGLMSPFILVLMLALKRQPKMGFRIKSWHLVILTGSAFISCMPWYLLSFIIRKNPFYPYFYQIFGPKGWESDVASSIGMGKGLWQYLIGLWNLTVHPASFGGGSNQLGPLFLSLLPLIFVAWRSLKQHEKQILRFLLVYFIFFYTVWFFIAQNLRFFLPISPALSILIGVSVGTLWSRKDSFFKIVKALFILLLAVNISFCFYYQANKIKGAFASNKEEYLKANSRTYRTARWVNDSISSDEKILICGEPAMFYFDPLMTSELSVRYLTQYHKRPFSESGIYEFLKSNGFSYVILRRWLTLKRLPADEFPEGSLADLIIKNRILFLELLHKEEFTDKNGNFFDYYVYRIK